MAADGDGIPWFLQFMIYTGGICATIIAALIGGRRKAGETQIERDDRLAAIEEELRHTKERESNRTEREHTDRDIAGLRRDFQEIIKQTREALENRIDAVKLELAEITGIETRIEVIERGLTGLRGQVARLSRKQPKGP